MILSSVSYFPALSDLHFKILSRRVICVVFESQKMKANLRVVLFATQSELQCVIVSHRQSTRRLNSQKRYGSMQALSRRNHGARTTFTTVARNVCHAVKLFRLRLSEPMTPMPDKTITTYPRADTTHKNKYHTISPQSWIWGIHPSRREVGWWRKLGSLSAAMWSGVTVRSHLHARVVFRRMSILSIRL
jgi:hypothetical protein